LLASLVIAVGLASLPALTLASHSWGNYHWARQQNPFTLKVGDNVTSAWDGHLNTSVADWSQSSVLDLTKVAGGARAKNCRPTAGRVEVCNARYGNNGWLGLAQIWVQGSHITQGAVKLNDTYFNTATYNTSAWRNLVMCQEIGHTFGLDHQDENFNNANLGTCMDYTSNPSTNQHPNQHDYQMLEQIYSHLDSTTTVGMVTNGNGNAAVPSSWGQLIRTSEGGRTSIYRLDLGHGQSVLTHVFWAS
jgi:hypothetical protein